MCACVRACVRACVCVCVFFVCFFLRGVGGWMGGWFFVVVVAMLCMKMFVDFCVFCTLVYH